MSAYRFCRTDDIGLLVDALNRCWAPYFPDEPPATPASFKRLIRDLQVWCSSCMVAFSGREPIAVLIGAKRPAATLVYRIAVHPDCRRQGHGRHLLSSLGSKLSILGPPRIVAEVPEDQPASCGLFSASGYVEEALLTDYVLCPDAGDPVDGDDRSFQGRTMRTGFVIPVTLDDLAANGLLGDGDGPLCWERSLASVTVRKDEMAGFAFASDERLEAYLLYIKDGDLVSLRSFVDDGGARLGRLLARARAEGVSTFRLSKVHPGEISGSLLKRLGFRPGTSHRLFATVPQSE